MPSQASANGKYLKSDGTNTSWDSVTPVVTNLQLNRASKVYSDSPYTALLTDYFIDYDATSGSSIVNLYTAVGNTGREIVISKTDSSTNTITIDPNASETIAGLSTIILRTQYESITIKSNGTNWDIVSSNLGSLTGGAGAYLPVFGCRAWVNFDGTTAADVSGTYSQSGTTVTVTASNHGHKVGHVIYSDITSGSGVDGIYTVASVIDANTFTYTAGSSLTTSGNITLNRRAIRASGNVSNVVYIGTGRYHINFTNPMPDANYSVVMTSQQTSGADHGYLDTTVNPSSNGVRLLKTSNGIGVNNVSNNCVSVFR